MKPHPAFSHPGSVLAAPMLSSSALAAPGDYWLQSWGFQEYEWDVDHDGDGFTARQEYYFGTNPMSRSLKPPTLLPSRLGGKTRLSWPSMTGASYTIGSSVTLQSWAPASGAMPGTGALMEFETSIEPGRKYYRL